MASRFHLGAGRVAMALSVMLVACVSLVRADATLFLEEPYGKLGFFTATGHAAVYLSGVCADSPVVLRPCEAGETGVVISRYDGVKGYDWVAIPLIPYLYAVNRSEDIPLFADSKMVAFLRERYRHQYLNDLIPDGKNGELPGGNWYELIGSSYDRAIYGFTVATTSEQDLALIRKLNSSPNRSHFRLVSRNCADFAKDILNFYYPKSMHRSIIADIGITTPKQMAKMLAKFSRRHPEIRYSRLVIAQVPGSMPRSFAVHSVVESFFKSKKYIVPSVIASPIFAGCIFAVYMGTGTGHFEPGREAMVLTPDGSSAEPIGAEDRKAYQHQLKDLLTETYPISSGKNVDKSWSRLQSRANIGFDSHRHPILQLERDGRMVRIGASADNVLGGGAPPEMVRQMLESRLQSELRGRSSRAVSKGEIMRDWKLLQQAMSVGGQAVAAHSPHTGDLRSNRP
jgi:hypothetical protein